MKVKFYHASPKRFKVGEVISGSYPHKNFDFCGQGVFLTTSPVPHFTISDLIENSRSSWYVYEVDPLGWMSLGNWGDIVSENALVISFVGNAQGLLKNFRRSRKNKNSGRSFLKGSLVKDYEVQDINFKISGRYPRLKRFLATQNRIRKLS